MADKLTAWGGAYLAGFMALGLFQKNFGLRLGLGLWPGLVVLGSIALIAGFAPKIRGFPELLWLLVGGWWAAHHSGLSRVYEASDSRGLAPNAIGFQATVQRSQPFSRGFNPWPYGLVVTAHRQFLVRGRFRRGQQGWLSCAVAGPRGEPCRFAVANPRSFRPHPLKKLADQGIRRLNRSIAAVRPKQAARFYQAVLLAKPRQLSATITASFKNLGIYHLLVTSGLHFAILLSFIQLVFTAVLRAAYSATLISPYSWFFCRRLSVVASFGVLFGYGLGLGLPAPVLRCLFMVGISQLAALSWWPLSLTPRLLLGLVAATVIFPLGFFTTGSLLSWGCTLLLCLWASPAEGGRDAKEGSAQPSRLSTLGRFLLGQGQLLLISLLLIGSYTPLAWLANGLIAAAFAPLLITGFGVIAGHALLGLTGPLGFIGSLALQFLAFVATIERNLPIGLILVPMRSPHSQLAAELAAVTVCGLSWYHHASQSEQPL